VKEVREEVLEFTNSASSSGLRVSRYDSPRPINAASYSRSAASVPPGF